MTCRRRRIINTDTERAEELAEYRRLEAAYPRWQVCRTGGGTWWATFDGPWAVEQERHGCMRQMNAETSARLEAALARAAACETCWRDVRAA